MQAMSKKSKEQALNVLTDLIHKVVEEVSGEDMQFVLFALPKNKPKDDNTESGMLCGNIPADKLSSVLRMAAEITRSTSSINEIKLQTETTH